MVRLDDVQLLMLTVFHVVDVAAPLPLIRGIRGCVRVDGGFEVAYPMTGEFNLASQLHHQ
jgi:hypothetical protein